MFIRKYLGSYRCGGRNESGIDPKQKPSCDAGNETRSLRAKVAHITIVPRWVARRPGLCTLPVQLREGSECPGRVCVTLGEVALSS